MGNAPLRKSTCERETRERKGRNEKGRRKGRERNTEIKRISNREPVSNREKERERIRQSSYWFVVDRWPPGPITIS